MTIARVEIGIQRYQINMARNPFTTLVDKNVYSIIKDAQKDELICTELRQDIERRFSKDLA